MLSVTQSKISEKKDHATKQREEWVSVLEGYHGNPRPLQVGGGGDLQSTMGRIQAFGMIFGQGKSH